MKLWTQGYIEGLGRAANHDLTVMASTAVSSLGTAWVAQIAATTLKQIARLLLAGATRKGIDTDRLHLVIVTEHSRAWNQARMDSMQEAGVTKIRWRYTSSNPCQRCRDNEEAGAVLLGAPFPSGALAPPDHPNCGCYVEEA